MYHRSNDRYVPTREFPRMYAYGLVRGAATSADQCDRREHRDEDTLGGTMNMVCT